MAQTLILRSSPTRLALVMLCPVLLLGLAGVGAAAKVTTSVVVIAVVGLLLAAVVLLDVPLRVEIDDVGLTRICVLRRQHFPWEDVVAIERTSGAPPRRGTSPEDRTARRGQGLAARTVRRRLYLLVDRRESHAEWTALRDLLKGRGTVLRATQPPLNSPPAGPLR